MKRYSRRGAKKTAVHDLPQELIIEILLRLPVKSLLRFKCVCKSWLSHISDPHFASSHYDLALSHTRRIVLFAPSAHEVRSIDSDASLHDDSACGALNLAFSPYQRCYKVKILGSCRGFLLLQYRLTLYVWNPSTGVHWHIPLRKNAGFSTYLYGFGYDPSTDDYLVVRASKSFGSQADRVTRVELFSLRANRWKEIGGLSNMHTTSSTKLGGLLFNGAIHWFIYRSDVHVNVILTFDLTERSFSEIPLPHGRPFQSQLPELQILGGFLCLCRMGFYNKQTEIWVMEEYKVLSSWKKTIVVCTHDVPTGSFFPLCFTKSGDIMGMHKGRGLVKCDDKGQVKEHRSFCDDYDRGFQVAVYTETLLSLPGDN